MYSNVEVLMKKKGIKVTKMADDLNVSDNEIYKARRYIEFCSMMFLTRIAKYLGCKVKDLFEEEE